MQISFHANPQPTVIWHYVANKQQSEGRPDYDDAPPVGSFNLEANSVHQDRYEALALNYTGMTIVNK